MLSVQQKVVLLSRLAALARSQPDTELRALGSTIESWIAADDPAPLEQVLGLAFTAGTNWRRDRALARRNGHIIAAMEASGDSARQLAARWRRYHCTSWPRHRTLDEVPSSIANKPEAHLWFALMADPATDPAPLHEGQIRRILNARLFRTATDSEVKGNGTRTKDR